MVQIGDKRIVVQMGLKDFLVFMIIENKLPIDQIPRKYPRAGKIYTHSVCISNHFVSGTHERETFLGATQVVNESLKL